MKMKTFTAFISAFFLASFASSAMALERVNLSPDAFKDAKGDVTIVQAGSPEQRRIDIELKGLEPNGVYTAWLSEEGTQKQSPIGKEGASFKSDNNGNARFSTVLSEREIERWDKIHVAFHPDGDPKNLDMAIFSLTGDLPPDV